MKEQLYSTSEIQHSLRQYLHSLDWSNPFALTLHFRRVRYIEGQSRPLFLTPDAASQNVRHFVNVLSQKTLGATACKFGKRVQFIPVMEISGDGVFHCHAHIECPNSELRSAFPSLMASIWSKTFWGAQIHVVPADSGWINYITKQRSKPVFADAIAWENAHLAIR